MVLDGLPRLQQDGCMNKVFAPVAPAANIVPVVERIETMLVDLPTIRPHKLSVATMDGQTLMLVKIHCSDGIVGIGEGATIGGLAYGGESPEGMKLAIDTYFAPVMTGQDATRVQALMARVGKMVKENRFAKSAVETALLDANGKRLGLPVTELLGGRRRDRLPVAWTLASGDTATDIAEAERMLDLRRHRIFKLKIGAKGLREDIAHVAAIKRALAERGAVRADVNMAWSETEAAYGIAALADAGCELVEQPVASAAALARLVRRFPVALMADEVLTGPDPPSTSRRSPARMSSPSRLSRAAASTMRSASRPSRMRPALAFTGERCWRVRSGRSLRRRSFPPSPT